MKGTLAERFWSKVAKLADCWPWVGGRDPSGYGRVYQAPRMAHAHRVAYELAFGPIPNGLWVLHKCDNPPCVRPEHLFLGTAKDNSHDAIRKGRLWIVSRPEDRARGVGHWTAVQPNLVIRGERHKNAKLTEQAVKEIRERRAAGVLTKQLAEEYALDRTTIQKVVSRKLWGHVE